MKTTSVILTLYSWGLFCIEFFFLFLIARFYEKKAERRSYYQLFFLPILLLSFSAVSYAFFGEDFVGNVVGDSLLFLAGVVQTALGYFLYTLMTGGER